MLEHITLRDLSDNVRCRLGVCLLVCLLTCLLAYWTITYTLRRQLQRSPSCVADNWAEERSKPLRGVLSDFGHVRARRV